MNTAEITCFAFSTWEKASKIWSLPGYPTISFNIKGKKTLGMAYRHQNRISFNLEMAEKIGKDFEEVIIHEISHLIQFIVYPDAKQAHGPEFRKICRTLGIPGSTKFYLKTDHFEWRCDCRTMFVPETTHEKYKRFGALCKRCGADVFYCFNVVKR